MKNKVAVLLFLVVVAPVDLNPLFLWQPYHNLLNGLLKASPAIFFLIYVSAFLALIALSFDQEDKVAIPEN